jgi:hypothetical protein
MRSKLNHDFIRHEMATGGIPLHVCHIRVTKFSEVVNSQGLVLSVDKINNFFYCAEWKDW